MDTVFTEPAVDAVVSLKTPEQLAFYTDSHRLQFHEADPEPNRNDGSTPLPVRFRWRASGRGEVLISEKSDFSFAMRFGGTGDVRVYNLLPGKVYYYCLECSGSRSEVRSFSIACELPRQICMPDVTNVRDCGGWMLASGRRYKFNMLFRGGEMEPWTVLPHGCGVNAQGEKVWRELKIKTDLDLRHDGFAYYGSEDVAYCKIPSSAYATWQEKGIFAPDKMEQIRKIFELFADETAYPIYMHCQGGGDRTGTIAFLLGAMLGMSYDDLITDYEYSNLSVSGERSRHSTVWRAFENKLQKFAPGGTIQQQVKKYLECCGVTAAIQEKITFLLTNRES